MAGAGAIVNNARLVIARSDTTTFRDEFSGHGTVEFRGGKVLYGSSTFTGAITAKGAFVRLDPGAVSAAAFTLENGSVLGGAATIGALTANAGATVAPGYSPGTIGVTGAVGFNAGSTYAVDVTPDGRHDLITATGPVTISSQAQVEVHATPGRYAPNSTYAIVTTTATVTGKFAGVTERLRLPQADAELRRAERLSRPDLQRAAVHRLRPHPQPVSPWRRGAGSGVSATGCSTPC